VIHEWPQALWRPVEHGFGFVSQVFGLRIIRKLVGIVRWYFDYHARLSKKEMAQYLPRLRPSEENSGRRGDGRVSSFNIQLFRINLQPWHILELFTIAQSLKYSEQFSRFGNELQKPGLDLLATPSHCRAKASHTTLEQCTKSRNIGLNSPVSRFLN
jgi:hypothetical protein